MHSYNKIIYNNPAKVWLSSLNSSVSIKNYTYALTKLCRLLGVEDHLKFNWAEFDYVRLLELKKILIDNNTMPSSINTYLGAMKSVAREAWRLEIIATDTFMRIQDVKRVKGESKPTGRALEALELKSLVRPRTRNNNPIELRDSAIIAVAYGAGLRREEITKLMLSDLNENKLLVQGKGRVIKYVYLPDFSLKVLKRWIKVRGNEKGALFTKVLKGGHIKLDRISTRTIGDITKKRYISTGNKHFSPHDLRRSFATNLLDSGVDISLVQKLMRHKKIETTRIYDMRGEKAKAAAVELLPF